MEFRYVLFLSLFFTNIGFSQIVVSEIKENFQYEITEATSEIALDGDLNDEAWTVANVTKGFWQKFPSVKENPDPKTEVRMLYDEHFLYVGAKMYQQKPTFIHTLKRDEYWDSDGIMIVLDPINTKNNVYLLGCTAGGVQCDAINTDGADDYNLDWSNKWISEVSTGDGFWSVEMAIPFKILKFEADNKEWGLNFVRNLTLDNAFHCWTSVPIQNWPIEPPFAGTLKWDKAPIVPKNNFNIIPYVTSGIISEEGGKPTYDLNAGVDARMAVSPTLGLDLTVNPDFSQIEVDELVTNLTRFNIFLPEKRTFFLENSDIFGDYGYGQATPFFSRKIGLNEDGQNVPILYGLRLSGNVSPDTRLGVMNIHSLGNDDSPGQNQSAFSIQKRFGRSFIRGMLLNRQAMDNRKFDRSDYGRNASLETRYNSVDGTISVWGGLHTSFKEGLNNKNLYYRVGMQYNTAKWYILNDYARIQENYYADMGFLARSENYDASRDTVIRDGFHQSYSTFQYRMVPETGRTVLQVASVSTGFGLNNDGSLNERETNIGYEISFRSGQSVGAFFNNYQINLLYPFSFVSSGENLPVANYHFSNVNANYGSDSRKAFGYQLSARVGQFYNGNITQLSVNSSYRVQPWGNFTLGYQWNNLKFPASYGSEVIGALLSKVEIGFSTKLLWTTLFQFVDQSEFMGINSRLQYRFSPMSDIYLVYVDNYNALNDPVIGRSYNSANRALLFKVNYWY